MNTLIECKLCDKSFTKPAHLKRHMNNKRTCITKERALKLFEETEKMKRIIDQHENDIISLVEENRDKDVEIKMKDVEIKMKDVEIKMKDAELNEWKREVELLERDCENKQGFICNLQEMITKLNTTNNVNVNSNNTIVVNQYFSPNIISNEVKMTLEQALNGLKGVADYISIHTVIDETSGLHCYYVTDASRSNGVYLDQDGNWIRDEGGASMQGIFGRVSHEIRQTIRDYKRGLLDDNIDEDNLPDFIVNNIRETRVKEMEKLRETLRCPTPGDV